MWALALVLALMPSAVLADSVVAVRTIRAKMVLSASDVVVVGDVLPGALRDVNQAVGLEARQTIFAGRPVTAGDLVEPAAVERNALVEMVYDRDGLKITTEGRALGRGAAGARVRVMNLASRVTVTGTVLGPGQVAVP